MRSTNSHQNGGGVLSHDGDVLSRGGDVLPRGGDVEFHGDVELWPCGLQLFFLLFLAYQVLCMRCLFTRLSSCLEVTHLFPDTKVRISRVIHLCMRNRLLPRGLESRLIVSYWEDGQSCVSFCSGAQISKF